MTAASAVEFLIWLLIAASAIALLARRLHIPYTAALVVGGLLLGLMRLPLLSPLVPGQRPNWLTPEVILILFLPALVFEGSIQIDVRDLLRDWAPLLLLANAGVLAATLVTGYLVHWAVGLPLMIALIFSAIISATDPISVLAIFKDLKMDKRLSVIIEGESLLNDGTAVVLFQVLLAAFLGGSLGVARGAGQFIFAVAGGAALGFSLGYVSSRLTGKIDDPEIEITLTTIVAYGSYLLAQHMHLSGVIATGSAGLMVGNLGVKHGMSGETRKALQSFWEYIAFVMNSLVFLLIGLEVHLAAIAYAWKAVLLAIAAVLIGRVVSVYPLVQIGNLFAERIPFRWQPVIIWGGLRGSLALALALSLDSTFPYRAQVRDLTFGVVVFSILVQGLTIKPLLRLLGLTDGETASR
ncbi:MAG TPA: Na+/H+ antiporter [Candidatus Saccharimonadales bacterium]|jgi:CPA1 family monovalent cation:H+ antiporter|nr:Na+/H+ antiporter [Candidatus Saccharimonadales bacterium]